MHKASTYWIGAFIRSKLNSFVCNNSSLRSKQFWITLGWMHNLLLILGGMCQASAVRLGPEWLSTLVLKLLLLLQLLLTMGRSSPFSQLVEGADAKLASRNALGMVTRVRRMSCQRWQPSVRGVKEPAARNTLSCCVELALRKLTFQLKQLLVLPDVRWTKLSQI